MPDQLAQSKKRQSLAEHEAVLAALAEIACREDTTVMALLRQAARELVRKRRGTPAQAKALSAVVWRSAPRMPKQFTSAAQLEHFREFRSQIATTDGSGDTPPPLQGGGVFLG